jgi:hypothetical protein
MTILAARNALRERIGFNIEGFCALNDVAIAVRALQAIAQSKKLCW